MSGVFSFWLVMFRGERGGGSRSARPEGSCSNGDRGCTCCQTLPSRRAPAREARCEKKRGVEHVQSSGVEHVQSSGVEHVQSSGAEHVQSSGVEHVQSSGVEHVQSSGVE